MKKHLSKSTPSPIFPKEGFNWFYLSSMTPTCVNLDVRVKQDTYLDTNVKDAVSECRSWTLKMKNN